MQLGLVVLPGCWQGEVGHSQGAGAEVVEMAFQKGTPYQGVEAVFYVLFYFTHDENNSDR